MPIFKTIERLVVYLSKKLTIKQKKFADEYIISGNASEAAIKAGYKNEVSGRENLQKPTIKAYIDQRLEEIDSEKIVSQKEVMELLSAIARGESTEQTLIGVGEGRQELIETRTTDKDRIKAMELITKRFGMNWSDLEREKLKLQNAKLKAETDKIKGVSEEVEDLSDINEEIYGENS